MQRVAMLALASCSTLVLETTVCGHRKITDRALQDPETRRHRVFMAN